jgi:hypothetical protein
MGDKVAVKMSFCVATTKCAWNKTPTIVTLIIKTQQLKKTNGA